MIEQTQSIQGDKFNPYMNYAKDISRDLLLSEDSYIFVYKLVLYHTN